MSPDASTQRPCPSGQINGEYDEFGYVFVVKVEPAAVNSTIDLQIYDPLFVKTGQFCARPADVNGDTKTPRDERLRHQRRRAHPLQQRRQRQRRHVPGLLHGRLLPPGGHLEQADDIVRAPPTGGQPGPHGGAGPVRHRRHTVHQAVRRHTGDLSNNTNIFKKNATGYNGEIAQNFHNWASFCRFTPTRAGDYYLQVRTNVKLEGTGTSLIRSGTQANTAAALTGNTTQGAGMNAFSLRAVTDGRAREEGGRLRLRAHADLRERAVRVQLVQPAAGAPRCRGTPDRVRVLRRSGHQPRHHERQRAGHDAERSHRHLHRSEVPQRVHLGGRGRGGGASPPATRTAR